VEQSKFDRFVRESVGISTRRTLGRSLAAMLGVAGIALTLGDEGEARRRQAKRQQRRSSKRRQQTRKKKQQKREEKREAKKAARQECNSDKPCPASTNPCQAIVCENNTCVTTNVADGTACGGNHTCTGGTCSCPSGVTCIVSVTPSSLNGWVGYDDNTEEVDNSILHFRSGPGTPIHGSGSVELDSPPDEIYNIATYQFAGMKLSELTALEFTLYTPADGNTGASDDAGYLQFNVSFDGLDTWQGRLRYTPRENGTVLRDTWQSWDAIDSGNAKWRWTGSGNWPPAAGGGPQPSASATKTWAQLLVDYPEISIRATDAFLGIRDGQQTSKQNTANIGSVTIATADGGTRFVFGPDS
jgi:hypothetical protein